MTADGRKRRKDRPIARRIQQARFRDPDPDAFDLNLNQRMNWALIHDLATARFILQRNDVAELTTAAHGTAPVPYLGVLSELSAVVALVMALFASRYGPFRRPWCGTDS